MPPFTCPTFEEIEAKEWASNTVNKILKEVTPISFEDIESEDIHDEMSNSHLRRSLSFLESSLFSMQQEANILARSSRRSQSTILPNTQHNNNNPYQFLAHIDNNFTILPLPKHDMTFINQRKKSAKEQKGIQIWKSKSLEYSVHPPWSPLQSSSNNSIQLSKFIMNELLSTEQTYLNHLLTIKNFYMDPLIMAAMNNKKSSLLVNLKNIEIIFSFIPELIMLSNTLVKYLNDTISNNIQDETNSNQVFIGKVFHDFEPYFEIYIAYAINYSKSRKYLTKASSNITYRQLIQDTMRKKDSNRMLLSDYMIAPIQRITRYCLLLTDLLKHSDKSHSDYIYLEQALKSFSALAFAMNTIQ